jgi:multiple sugar transport system permease protein
MRGREAVLRPIAALAVTVLFLAPLALLVLGALRDPTLPPPRGPELLPAAPTLASFERAETLAGLTRAAINSLLVAVVAVPLAVLVASAAGFAISRLAARPRRVLVGLSVVALMVPVTALLLPRFLLFRTAGLTDGWVPLVAPALLGMTPLTVLLYAWAFRRHPDELFDAARLEGVPAPIVWWRFGLPLVRPVTAVVGVLAFVSTWNDVLGPLVYVTDSTRFTLPLALRALAVLPAPQYPVMLAGAIVATLPVVVAVALGQRSARQSGLGW